LAPRISQDACHHTGLIVSHAMKYRPDIDGLRAIAVLPVVFYHAGLPGFSGGFVGVDVFFVISGYLITGILHKEMLAGHFSILSFYERRARRILPALFLVLTASLAAGWVWLAPEEYGAMAGSAGATLLFASNMWFWQNSGGYFDGATDYLPLLHTWSLAVEEQFYIGFPLLLMVLVRLGRRATLGVTLALVGGSLALAIWATPQMPSASFYLLPTRIWELGIGSLLALGLAPGNVPRWARETVAAIGLAAIVLAATLYDASTSFPGLGALPPVLGAAALIWAGGQGRTLTGRLLSWRPVVFIGLLSYSLYLWHWPIMAFARNRLLLVELPAAWQAGTILLAFAAAWASWRFVERPFRAGRARSLGRNAIFALSGVGTGALAAAAVAVFFTGGAERRFTPDQVAELDGIGLAPEVPDCRNRQDPVRPCTFGNPDASRRWLLWGDSHAAALLPVMDKIAGAQNLALEFASEAACPPLPGLIRSAREPGQRAKCLQFNDRLVDEALSGGYEAVILHARWPLYVEGKRYGSEVDEPSILALAGASDFPPDASGNPSLVYSSLTGVLRRLTSAGVRVVLVAPVPELPWDVGLATKASVLYDTPMPPDPATNLVQARQARTLQLLAAAAEMPGVRLVHFAAGICDSTCPTHDARSAFYRDNNHMTAEGERRLVAPILAEALADWPPRAAKTPATTPGTS